ncbi:medium-chain acyl-CoA ligase ACSF2, mitochondrial-like [Branchiostoma floridae]|uniref:Medium-chain acyl-CoA ligase ACSF2, mitochondrial-like n=1 Tax=Branchiostoma floridae TaxID=7739 RepID=A0A9J7HLT0_BRAFL|nr:medium-chain acyl-CoA ligase ACSF2, mitochondrial-like [Branchiostoma floridae]
MSSMSSDIFNPRRLQANRLAAGLKAIGTERGDVVAWLVGHRPEWIYLYFAVAKLGAIALPLQAPRVGRSAEAMTYCLKKAGVKVLIMGDITGVNETDDTVPYLCSLFPEVKTTKPGKLQIERLPKLTSIIVLGDIGTGIGAYSMDEVQTLGSDEKLIAEVRALQHQLSCHDTFLLVFSSGSTGQPKCSEHSTYSLYNSIRFAVKVVRMPLDGVTLYPYLSTPYYVICPMFAPGCAVAVPASTAPSSMEITKTIQEERCHSIVVLFLKDFHDLLHSPNLGEYDMSSIRGVNIGGNVAPKSLIDRAADVLPKAKVIVAYGMTELVKVTAIPADMIGEGKGAAVGKLAPHVEMQLVDKDGRVVPLGHEGEVCLRGYCLFKRYRGDEEKTSKAITADGWFKTGDVGTLDEHGVLKLYGRASEMIIRNAYNVHPAVVEAPLSKHPKVQDVRVVSVPDPASVEEICACIILKEGQSADSDEMKKFCDEIGMVPIELPGYFVFFDEFPVTTTLLKVDRKKLRLIAMEKLGLQET